MQIKLEAKNPRERERAFFFRLGFSLFFSTFFSHKAKQEEEEQRARVWVVRGRVYNKYTRVQ